MSKEKKIIRYFCSSCKMVIRRLRLDKCPYCGRDCEQIHVAHTKWWTIGKLIVISAGFVLWVTIWLMYIVPSYVLHTEESPFSSPVEGGIVAGLLAAVPSVLATIVFLIILYRKDNEVIIEKVYKMKNTPPPISIFPRLHREIRIGEKACNRCMRVLPREVNKCPYCGYEYK